MRESCALRLTIRYLLMFVHRRDLEQSSVSRFPRQAWDDRVWESYAKPRLYILLNPSKNSLGFLIQKPSRFSHTGVWGGMRAGFGLGVFAAEFRASKTGVSPIKNAIFQKTGLVFSTQCVKNYASQNRKESE